VKLEFRPLLVSGMLTISGDILIDNEQTEFEQIKSVWHEMLHLLLLAAGSPHASDEAYVDALAGELAMATPSDFLEKLKPV
jgi:hypothetical protein